MAYPENQEWQQECTVCHLMRCPKPEKVAEWMTNAVRRTHEAFLIKLTGLRDSGNWRFLIASTEAHLEACLSTWAWALKGVCSECLEQVDPEAHDRFFDGSEPHADAYARWLALVPEETETKASAG